MFHVAQFFSNEKLSASDKFETLLLSANTLLALSFSVLLATVVVCYPLSYMFPFELQMAGHVAMIFSATLVKIAYVCRCIAQHELHKEVR
ncbi:hypothetical protein [Rheinheimera tangshanensis]|uniref:Uncharacterized protein n=1 Tax=Rheinheimera tangshanensis TaxID=400153 RepID=A0A5C8M1Y6_9GAMM|nr:hypothetical protein [Rheinheimera tangshanensis]TXK82453.1 hypothetical protein FU839_06090 [Rheinheimera tangshanensis]GGM54957.1 hypothetical protein GCM10010920_14240 [Rheinheimera tangshanensis]